MKQQKKEILLIFLCWFVYTSAYLGRYSYNSNITPIMLHYGVSHAEAALATTFFFFAYGAGQILNGILTKYFNKKLVLSGALLVSAALNLSVFLGVPFRYIKYLWLVNGIVQSVLWPSLLAILSENLHAENLKKSVVVMSSTVAVGLLLTYGASALLATFNGFRFSFLIGSVITAFAAMIWFCSYDRLTGTPELSYSSEEKEVTHSIGLSGAIWAFVIVLCVIAALCNLVKDGLNTWVPSILVESYGLPDSLSIFLTLILPILGMAGTILVVTLNKWIRSYLVLVGTMFLSAAICLLAVIFLLKTSYWPATLVLFGLLSMLMHGANNVITSMVPLYLRSKADTGALAGILDGACYVGSTVSSYCLGTIVDRSGWNAAFYLLFGLSILPVLIGIFNILTRKEEKILQ